jgi:hypothetical protein
MQFRLFESSARVLPMALCANTGGRRRKMATLTTSMKNIWIAGPALMLVTAALLAGCGGNYYQVTDADSGKSYYTRDIDRDDGHVEFTDKATGDKVGLDKFEIREVTRQQYKNAVPD